MTGATDPPTEPAAAPGSRTPAEAISYPPWLWAVGGLLLLMVVLAVVALVNTSGKDSPSDAGGAVEALLPSANAQLNQQDRIGIDLLGGYDAELAVNGVPLPLDQLVIEKGLNTVTFKPGPGQEFERWEGQTCVTATFWPSASPTQVGTRTWCFTSVL